MQCFIGITDADDGVPGIAVLVTVHWWRYLQILTHYVSEDLVKIFSIPKTQIQLWYFGQGDLRHPPWWTNIVLGCSGDSRGVRSGIRGGGRALPCAKIQDTFPRRIQTKQPIFEMPTNLSFSRSPPLITNLKFWKIVNLEKSREIQIFYTSQLWRWNLRKQNTKIIFMQKLV